MPDNQPKPKWYAGLNAKRKAWRAANPKAHDITMAVIVVAVVAVVAFGIGVARGATPDFFAGCPANAVKITAKPGHSIDVKVKDEVVSIMIVVPGGREELRVRQLYVKSIDVFATKEATLSKKPCDLSEEESERSTLGVPFYRNYQNDFSMKYRVGNTSETVAGLTPGGVYFLNIRNTNCGAPVGCRMVGSL